MSIRICNFAALDDIPKRKLSRETVLGRLREVKRCSSFELSDSPKLAGIVKGLEHEGIIKLIDAGYPWYKVEILGPEPKWRRASLRA